MHPPLLWVSPFLSHHEVLTLSKNVPKQLILSENQLLKQRIKKKRKPGPQCGVDSNGFLCITSAHQEIRKGSFNVIHVHCLIIVNILFPRFPTLDLKAFFFFNEYFSDASNEWSIFIVRIMMFQTEGPFTGNAFP